MNTLKSIFLLFFTALLGACADTPTVLPDGTSVVEGVVIYDGLDVVPAGDVVEVMLVNVSDPEILTAVARDRINDPAGGAVTFDIVYKVQALEPGNAYALCARAMDASGDTLWQSDQPTPVSLPSDASVEVFVTDNENEWDECAEWEN